MSNDIIDDYFERKAAGDPEIKKQGEEAEAWLASFKQAIHDAHEEMLKSTPRGKIKAQERDK